MLGMKGSHQSFFPPPLCLALDVAKRQTLGENRNQSATRSILLNQESTNTTANAEQLFPHSLTEGYLTAFCP